MSDVMTPDERARAAAQRLVQGDASTVVDALRLVRIQQPHLGGPDPDASTVRRHADAMEQAMLGEASWKAARFARLEALEELMAFLEEHATRDPVVVAGPAADGHVGPGTLVRLRHYTRVPIGVLADELVAAGSPEPSFETLETRFGRLDGMRFEDDAGLVLLARLMPERWPDRGRNLYRDAPVAHADLATVRRRVATTRAAMGDGGGDPGDPMAAPR